MGHEPALPLERRHLLRHGLVRDLLDRGDADHVRRRGTTPQPRSASSPSSRASPIPTAIPSSRQRSGSRPSTTTEPSGPNNPSTFNLFSHWIASERSHRNTRSGRRSNHSRRSSTATCTASWPGLSDELRSHVCPFCGVWTLYTGEGRRLSLTPQGGPLRKMLTIALESYNPRLFQETRHVLEQELD